MSLPENGRFIACGAILNASAADEGAVARPTWRYTRRWRTPDRQAQWHEAVPTGVAPLWLFIEGARCEPIIALASAPKPYALLRRLLTPLSRRR